jgi:indolepyruvate ferredoxin oxidoreductase alpha subunit
MTILAGSESEDKKRKYERSFAKYSSRHIEEDGTGQTVLLSCAEAIARGAVEAGVRVAASYPGAPVQYVLDNLLIAKAKHPSMHVEWSTNEKVAFEVALGASLAGVRALTIMKNVGLNVACDTLASSALFGVRGFVIVVSDDPSSETTQNEQDTRSLALYAEIPILEPSTMQEVKDFTRIAFELSEDLRIPVMVRIMERMGYSRGPAVLRRIPHDIRERRAQYDRDDPWSTGSTIERKIVRGIREPHQRFHGEASKEVEKYIGPLPKMTKVVEAANSFEYNKLEMSDTGRIGLITAGMCYPVVSEALEILGALEEVAVLKLAMSYPIADSLVRKLLAKVETVLVVEEIEPLIENSVRSISADMDRHAKILGKLTGELPFSGEIERDMVGSALARILGKEYEPSKMAERIRIGTELYEEVKGEELPRQCAGCPEHAAIYALKMACKDMGIEYICFGDTGCYEISAQHPLHMQQSSYCMRGHGT